MLQHHYESTKLFEQGFHTNEEEKQLPSHAFDDSRDSEFSENMVQILDNELNRLKEIRLVTNNSLL